MKHLVIRVGDMTLFDGYVDEIVFTDSDAGVGVQGKMRRPGPTGSGLLELLAAATKQTPKPQEDNNDG